MINMNYYYNKEAWNRENCLQEKEYTGEDLKGKTVKNAIQYEAKDYIATVELTVASALTSDQISCVFSREYAPPPPALPPLPTGERERETFVC